MKGLKCVVGLANKGKIIKAPNREWRSDVRSSGEIRTVVGVEESEDASGPEEGCSSRSMSCRNKSGMMSD